MPRVNPTLPAPMTVTLMDMRSFPCEVARKRRSLLYAQPRDRRTIPRGACVVLSTRASTRRRSSARQHSVRDHRARGTTCARLVLTVDPTVTAEPDRVAVRTVLRSSRVRRLVQFRDLVLSAPSGSLGGLPEDARIHEPVREMKRSPVPLVAALRIAPAATDTAISARNSRPSGGWWAARES
jgi:hypothetical protein